MKKSLDYQLVKDFPGLYRERFLDKKKTCMCWGFQCNDGWEPLIRDLSNQLQLIIDTFKITIVVDEVKEKYGTLRFYYSESCRDDGVVFKNLDEIIAACVQRAETISAHRCEVCGEYGFLCIKPGRLWYKTLCKEHARELGYEAERDFLTTARIPQGDYCYTRKAPNDQNCPFIHFCDDTPGSWCSLLKESPTEKWELDETNHIPKLAKCKRRFCSYIRSEV